MDVYKLQGINKYTNIFETALIYGQQVVRLSKYIFNISLLLVKKPYNSILEL